MVMKLPILTPVEGSARAQRLILENADIHDARENAKRQPTRQCTIRIKATEDEAIHQNNTRVSEKEKKRKSRTLGGPKKRQAPPTYRISLEGPPQYFLEPTLTKGTMFLGRTDTKQILGLLADGEIITSQHIEKMYFLSKVGLTPSNNTNLNKP